MLPDGFAVAYFRCCFLGRYFPGYELHTQKKVISPHRNGLGWNCFGISGLLPDQRPLPCRCLGCLGGVGRIFPHPFFVGCVRVALDVFPIRQVVRVLLRLVFHGVDVHFGRILLPASGSHSVAWSFLSRWLILGSRCYDIGLLLSIVFVVAQLLLRPLLCLLVCLSYPSHLLGEFPTSVSLSSFLMFSLSCHLPESSFRRWLVSRPRRYTPDLYPLLPHSLLWLHRRRYSEFSPVSSLSTYAPPPVLSPFSCLFFMSSTAFKSSSILFLCFLVPFVLPPVFFFCVFISLSFFLAHAVLRPFAYFAPIRPFACSVPLLFADAALLCLCLCVLPIPRFGVVVHLATLSVLGSTSRCAHLWICVVWIGFCLVCDGADRCLLLPPSSCIVSWSVLRSWVLGR